MASITVRLPDDIHAIISQLAVDEDRSVNAQIVRLLRESLIAKGALPRKAAADR